MDVIQQGILILIRSAITGQAMPLPEGFCLADAEEIAVVHQIVGLVYEGAILCGISKSDPTMARLFQRYCQIVYRSNAQLKAVETLFAAFEEVGVDYMPVKGCILKGMYPQAAMRVMTDADILIHQEQYGSIRSVVEAQGYQERPGDDHVFLWTGKVIELELHRRLVPSTDEDYYNYIGDGWQRAKQIAGHRYELSAEDLYIFLLVHFAKHYRSSGIGLRQAVDLWVYKRACPDMDQDYLRRELEKVQLADFYENIDNVLRFWFENGEASAKTAFISQFIFDSGSWGTAQQRELFTRYKYVKKTGSVAAGRRSQIFHAIFPNQHVMKQQHPVLCKCPWLLPVMWPVRWVKVLLFRRHRIHAHMILSEEQEIQKVKSLEESLKFVGLN